MKNVFNVIPNNFFNPLASNSNYWIHADIIQFIYEQYDEEISYRIKRTIIRDELAYFLSENYEELRIEDENMSKSFQDIASDYLRKFSSKDVGWLEEEYDDSTFEKYIVITESGILLAELLTRLERPEREEFSSYIYNIYNTLTNEEQWSDDPYVFGLKSVYRNAKDLSKSLKKMSTFIRKTIEKLIREASYESLTENIISYCEGDFIKEYSRLTKQQNIHVYRRNIIAILERMRADSEIYELMVIGCVNEEDLDECKAQEKVDNLYSGIKRFLQDDYIKIMADIKHKLNLYITLALGRLRYLKNHEVDMRGNVERTLKYILTEMKDLDLKKEVPNEMKDFMQIYQHKYIDLASIQHPRNRRQVQKQIMENVEFLSEEDIENMRKIHEQEARNPYSKKVTKAYIKSLIGNKGEISSDEIPLTSKNDLLMALSAVAYAKENGFQVEAEEGYIESNHMLLKAFRVKER